MLRSGTSLYSLEQQNAGRAQAGLCYASSSLFSYSVLHFLVLDFPPMPIWSRISQSFIFYPTILILLFQGLSFHRLIFFGLHFPMLHFQSTRGLHRYFNRTFPPFDCVQVYAKWWVWICIGLCHLPIWVTKTQVCETAFHSKRFR